MNPTVAARHLHNALAGAITVKDVAIFLAVAFAAAGIAQLAHEKTPRLVAWSFAAAAFLAAIGIAVWTDALASLAFTSVWGLAVLAAVTVLSGLSFFHQAGKKESHKKHHHHIRTPVLAALFGTSLVLFIGALGTIIRGGLMNPVTTAKAFGNNAYSLGSGHATKAGLAMPHGERNLIFLGVAAGFFVVLWAARRYLGGTFGRKNTGAAAAPSNGGGRGGRAAAPAARGAAGRGAITGGRK